MSSIYIIWLRQVKRYLRSKSRMISSLGQPILFLVALGFGFGPIYQKAGGGNYMQFLAPGIIGQTILFSSIFFGIELIWDRQFGFLKETLVAPVSRWKIILGRTLGGATLATLQGILVFLLTLLVGFRPISWWFFPFAVLVMFLLALLFTSLGTTIASLLEDFQGFQMIMNFLVMPLFFLSGALFPLDGFPKILQTVASFNPLSYGVDGLRHFLAGVSHFSIYSDFLVLIACAFFLLALGSYLFSKIQI